MSKYIKAMAPAQTYVKTRNVTPGGTATAITLGDSTYSLLVVLDNCPEP
jgi:hypothetical protein